jgi:HEAT repeat protein
LILSLRHPIPENQMMAIQLLGELKSSSALPVLASMLCEEEDFFVIREIALALCRIGTRESWELIDGLRHHPSRLVRDYAHLLSTESLPGIEPDRSSRGQG